MADKNPLNNNSAFDLNIMNRISDGFVALDADWNYTFVNKKAGELFGRTPESLIGKHIWTEFPEGISEPFHLMYLKAMETQKYQELREYYAPWDRWFENRIYPSVDGLSIFFTDITAKVQSERITEDELEKFQLFKSFFNNTKDSIQVSREDGYLVYANAEAIDRLGIQPDKINEIHVIDFEDDFNSIEDWKNHLIEMKKVRNKIFESTNTNLKTGKKFPIEVTLTYEIINGTGYIIAISRDITSRKNTENKLLYSQEFTQRILESMNDGFSMLNLQGEHVLVNEAFCKMLGYTAEELIGTGVPHLYWPDEHLDSISHAIEETKKGENKDYQLFFKRKNGEQFPVIVSPSQIKDEDGNVTRLIATIKDISDLYQAHDLIFLNKQRLKAVLDSSNLGIWDYDVAKKQTTRTLQHDRCFGLSEYHHDWNYDFFLSFIHDEDKAFVKSAYDEMLLSGKDYSVDYRVKLKDGTERWLNSAGRGIYNAANRLERVTGIVQDITDRKLSEIKIIESNREKETLLAEIHHRVKNNLAVVAGLMYLQTKDSDNEELIERLTINIDRINSIASIHEELYKSHDFSRICFSSNITKVVKNLQAITYQSLAVDIELNLDEVYVDISNALPAALIVNELVTNSYKHAFDNTDSPKISITLNIVDDIIHLTIADNGPGIPDNFAPNNSLSVGLNLVHSLAEQIDATFEMKNNNGLECLLKFENNY